MNMKKIIKTDNAPSPIGPYSQAVVAGNMLFISGQIGVDVKTQEYTPADVEAEARLVMTNIKAILDAAGFDFSHVVKSTIFLKDMNDFSKVNAVYGSYFTSDFPARECVQVAVLPRNCKVEISCICYKP